MLMKSDVVVVQNNKVKNKSITIILNTYKGLACLLKVTLTSYSVTLKSRTFYSVVSCVIFDVHFKFLILF